MDEDGVSWGFPALWPPPKPAGPSADTALLPDPSEVLAEAQGLAAARAFAAAHQARPFGGTASSRHAVLRSGGEAPDDLVGRAAAPNDPVDRARSMEIGTAFHAALERLALDAPMETWCSALEATLAEQGLDPVGLERCRELVQRFLASPLADRLSGLGERLIGREVPLLLAPEAGEDEPVGYVAGTIDLLYRDEDGHVVVVDYKTDAIDGPLDLDRRSQAYAPQGRVYVRAVQAALGLAVPPRFELWFVGAGQLAPVEV